MTIRKINGANITSLLQQCNIIVFILVTVAHVFNHDLHSIMHLSPVKQQTKLRSFIEKMTFRDFLKVDLLFVTAQL